MYTVSRQITQPSHDVAQHAQVHPAVGNLRLLKQFKLSMKAVPDLVGKEERDSGGRVVLKVGCVRRVDQPYRCCDLFHANAGTLHTSHLHA